MVSSDPANRVALLGPSVRAFARSAVAAGFRVVAVDDYCDLDLREVCEQAHRSPTGAEAFERLLADAKPIAWSYGGGWENKPDLVRRLAQVASLWGTEADALAILRDPMAWTAALRDAGILVPETVSGPIDGRSEKRWLSKSASAAGGAQVHFAESAEGAPFGLEGSSAERRFLQEFIPGEVESASFVAGPDGTIFLGACRQIVGAKELGACGFQFAGAVGPLPLTNEERAFFLKLGQAVAAVAPIRGLFGVDGIRRADGRWLPIEINPRYTASMETLERASGGSFFAEHAAAFGCRLPSSSVGLAPSPAKEPRHGSEVKNPALEDEAIVVGKAILYAQAELSHSFDLAAWRDFQERFSGVTLADLPQPGTISRPGEPVLTLLLAARSPDEACSALLSAGPAVHAELFRRFGS